MRNCVQDTDTVFILYKHFQYFCPCVKFRTDKKLVPMTTLTYIPKNRQDKDLILIKIPRMNSKKTFNQACKTNNTKIVKLSTSKHPIFNQTLPLLSEFLISSLAKLC